MGGASTFSEIFKKFIYDVRYFLLYILFPGFSAALCLGAMYRHDKVVIFMLDAQSVFRDFRLRRPPSENLTGIISVVRNSSATTFQIIFGNFDSDDILDADYAWAKLLFFFGFQVLTMITY